MKRLFCLLFCIIFLAGCTAAPEKAPSETIPVTVTEAPVATEANVTPEPAVPDTIPMDPVEELLRSMPLEDWVGQLFLVGADPNLAEEHIREYNLGGFLLFSADFKNETPGNSAAQKIARWQEISDVPLLIAVDEEGGTVTRVSCYSYYRSSRFSSPRELFAQGGMDAVLAQEAEKCQLLQSLGVNVNLGPVCDITTDPSAFMYQRSLGQDAEITSDFVSQMVKLKQQYAMGSALKHFPGYGNNIDTHTGIAFDSRSLTMLEGNDLIPFQAGIDDGAGAIMVSHTIVEALDPELPASLSPAVHQYLRKNMGFDGVIITDDLTMQAITDRYGAGEAAVMAVQAGSDLLCSSSFIAQYEAVLAAVLDGRIDYDTLKNSVRNVLEWKLELGLL